LSPQVLSAWLGLLRSHAELTRAMNAQLIAEHGITLNDYDVMVNLAEAPGGVLRRVDLADRVLLTASGITRLLEGLERAGWVCKRACDADARVTYAVLTDAGYEKLKEASVTHHEDIGRMFTSRSIAPGWGGCWSASGPASRSSTRGRGSCTPRPPRRCWAACR
jgi:DNA-binding MarR family transcriptional regulator